MITKLFLTLSFLVLFFTTTAFAGETPDTVVTGIYVNSIHNIDFKQKEYAISLWLWLKYHNPEFAFDKNLEIPQAKNVEKSFVTTDTLEDGRIYMLMKLDCIMKDSWKTNKFPFDFQTLRLSFENSQYDSTALVFQVDTAGERYGRFTISGWKIVPYSFITRVRNQPYKTTFGDESLAKPYTSYSSYRVRIGIEREASWTMFWKTFIGMYVAFFIAFVCFFIHSDSIDARFALNVGALFAVVGNKYIIDSSLPDSLLPTLVDMLHSITLIFIFAIIAATIYSLKLLKLNKTAESLRFDAITSRIVLLAYFALNIFFIVQANR